jgi:hypothetical protein
MSRVHLDVRCIRSINESSIVKRLTQLDGHAHAARFEYLFIRWVLGDANADDHLVVTFVYRRVSGPDRYATAAAVASDFPRGLPWAFLAGGSDFADPLTGGVLAGRLGVPILLTDGPRLLPAAATALERLAPGTVLVIGGPEAIAAPPASP